LRPKYCYLHHLYQLIRRRRLIHQQLQQHLKRVDLNLHKWFDFDNRRFPLEPKLNQKKYWHLHLQERCKFLQYRPRQPRLLLFPWPKLSQS
jgi:hypothetical protein